jgi:RHS repeat-associated protein
VKKTTRGSSRYFAYDEAGHLVGEYDNSGNLIQETVWFGDTPVAALRPNGAGVNLFYVHTDHLNTPRRISRPSDNVIVWRWDGDPFGTTVANEDPDGDSNSFAYALRFPGQYLDSETGLHYNYFRDYDPALGSYLESDPLGMVDGPSTYAYVRNSPVGLTDRYGLISDDECCLRSQQLGQNANAQGWVICCEGRKVPCSFAPKVTTKADAIRRKCTIEHEKSHLREIECTSCTKDPVRPNRSGPGAMDYNLSECTAGRRGLDCYRRSIRECGNDEQCRKEIQDTIFRLGRYYERCWGGI